MMARMIQGIVYNMKAPNNRNIKIEKMIKRHFLMIQNSKSSRVMKRNLLIRMIGKK
jgi:hypothetical protein